MENSQEIANSTHVCSRLHKKTGHGLRHAPFRLEAN
jgi:hypothetical protein